MGIENIRELYIGVNVGWSAYRAKLTCERGGWG